MDTQVNLSELSDNDLYFAFAAGVDGAVEELLSRESKESKSVDNSLVRSIMGRVGRKSSLPDITEELRKAHEKELIKFFNDQREAVKSALGKKALGVFVPKEWDKQLTALLTDLGTATAKSVGPKVAAGLDHEWDPALGQTYIGNHAARAASGINAKTGEQLDTALENADDPEEATDSFFDGTMSVRANKISATEVAVIAGAIALFVAKAANAGTKTWVTGPNPRPSHATLDGETVSISEPFSNGMMHPGDWDGNVDEVAGCNCTLTFNKE